MTPREKEQQNMMMNTSSATLNHNISTMYTKSTYDKHSTRIEERKTVKVASLTTTKKLKKQGRTN